MAKTSQLLLASQSEEHMGDEGSACVMGVPSAAKMPTLSLFLSSTREERDGPMDMPRTELQPENTSFSLPDSVSRRALP